MATGMKHAEAQKNDKLVFLFLQVCMQCDEMKRELTTITLQRRIQDYADQMMPTVSQSI
jgi:hypothetical protein